MRIVVALVLAVMVWSPGARAEPHRRSFTAHDTLSITADAKPEAQRVLEGIAWEPAPEGFRVEASMASGDEAAVVRFPSPRGSGDGVQGTVPMQWFVARDGQGRPREAPALLLVHSLHPLFPETLAIARELSKRGIHAFVIHMPGYGLREDDGPAGVTALMRLTQAVGDIRRARDAIAALPNVREGAVALSGVSMGGFASATAAALDGAFDPVILIISGGDGFRVLQEGRHDAAAVRRSMARAGYEGERLRELVGRAEPLAVAHRLEGREVWLFTARDDTVIPRFSSDALVAAAGIPPERRVELAGDHYTVVLALPGVINRMEAILKGRE